MRDIYSVAVFCGSRPGANPAFAAAAQELGFGLAAAGIRLVYGGGKNGLMGILADASLVAGGTVLGVIPDFLTKWEVAHDGLTELAITDSMHSRKRRMAEEADAFITLPGGVGTLDETIEILSWRQLRLHDKPIYVCDVAGSAGPFVTAVEEMIAQGFADPEVRALFTLVDGVPALLDHLGRELHRSVVAASRF
ncbi:MAG: TIGR00730 family Rossman fold protein [Acetobacteraceae bacterium]|nr:TIGR00730 family Rossman fold protein [Acetobacteraceae bacterium]